MPGKKKGQYKRRGRRHRRRGVPMLALGRSPIPRKSLVKLRYCTRVPINPAAGVTNSHIFRANSLFDPDSTGVGHQPLGFDQWINFYKEYCVLGSKITVTPINISTTIPLQFGVVLRQFQLPGMAVDPTLLIEQGDSNWKYVGNLNNSATKSVSLKFSTKRFLGVKNPIDEKDLRGDDTVNPSMEGFYQVWCAAADGAADPASIVFQVTIDYIAMFIQPQALAQS